MIKKLIGNFFNHQETSTGQETFVRLIQLTKEDINVRSAISKILNLESSERKYALSKIIESMRKNNESKDIIEAISVLQDDHLAEKLLEYINH